MGVFLPRAVTNFGFVEAQKSQFSTGGITYIAARKPDCAKRQGMKTPRPTHPLLEKISLLHQHPLAATFFVLLALLLWLNASTGISEFYGDAHNYWQIASSFQDPASGRFALTNFKMPLRGYLFPLILYALQKSSSLLGMRG